MLIKSMTDRYKQKLIQLAKEIIAFNQGKIMIVDDKKKVEQIQIDMKEQYNEKLNHLLGYILALDDLAQTRPVEDANKRKPGCYDNSHFLPSLFSCPTCKEKQNL